MFPRTITSLADMRYERKVSEAQKLHVLTGVRECMA